MGEQNGLRTLEKKNHLITLEYTLEKRLKGEAWQV